MTPPREDKIPRLTSRILTDRADASFAAVFAALDVMSIKPLIYEQKTIFGYHGTCLLRARSIKSTGWKPSMVDRRLGPGVYFYQDSEAMSGTDAAFSWAGKTESGPNCPDPCVVACEIRNVNVLDLTDAQNLKYLSDLRQRLVQAIYSLADSLSSDYGISLDMKREICNNARAFDEHFVGQRINLCAASWRPKVDVIRSFFHVTPANIDTFGFVVAQGFDAINIKSLKKF